MDGIPADLGNALWSIANSSGVHGLQFPTAALLYFCPQTLQRAPNPGYSQESSPSCVYLLLQQLKAWPSWAGEQLAQKHLLPSSFPGGQGRVQTNKWALGSARERGFLGGTCCAGCHKETTLQLEGGKEEIHRHLEGHSWTLAAPGGWVQCTTVSQPLGQHSPAALPSLRSSSTYREEGTSQVTTSKAIRVLWVHIGFDKWADRRNPLAVPILTGTLQCPDHWTMLDLAVALSSWGLWVAHVGHICAGTVNSGRERTQGLHLHHFWCMAQSMALGVKGSALPTPVLLPHELDMCS